MSTNVTESHPVMASVIRTICRGSKTCHLIGIDNWYLNFCVGQLPPVANGGTRFAVRVLQSSESHAINATIEAIYGLPCACIDTSPMSIGDHTHHWHRQDSVHFIQSTPSKCHLLLHCLFITIARYHGAWRGYRRCSPRITYRHCLAAWTDASPVARCTSR